MFIFAYQLQKQAKAFTSNQNKNRNRPYNELKNVQPANPQLTQQTLAPAIEKPSPSSTVTQEEIEFDEQFRKWQEEFDKWKRANVNHPDKIAYKQYEEQFESVRVKLLQV